MIYSIRALTSPVLEALLKMARLESHIPNEGRLICRVLGAYLAGLASWVTASADGVIFLRFLMNFRTRGQQLERARPADLVDASRPITAATLRRLTAGADSSVCPPAASRLPVRPPGSLGWRDRCRMGCLPKRRTGTLARARDISPQLFGKRNAGISSKN